MPMRSPGCRPSVEQPGGELVDRLAQLAVAQSHLLVADDERRPRRPFCARGIEELSDRLAEERLVARPMDITELQLRHRTPFLQRFPCPDAARMSSAKAPMMAGVSRRRNTIAAKTRVPSRLGDNSIPESLPAFVRAATCSRTGHCGSFCPKKSFALVPAIAAEHRMIYHWRCGVDRRARQWARMCEKTGREREYSAVPLSRRLTRI